jgi:alpha-1,6-mannosyltransferase
MKLCDVALYSPETSSGVRTYIKNKMRYVSARPQPMEHVLLVPGREDKLVVQGRSRIYYVRGMRSFYPKVRLVANIVKVARIIEAEAPDLIELNCQFTLPWAAFLATRKSRVPVIGVYHFDLPACVRHITRNAGRPIASLCERAASFYVSLLYRHFTRTLILNESMAPKLRDLGVDRVETVPCGVDIATFNPSRRDLGFRQGLGIHPARKILLYVGRLSPEKEVGLLLKAHSRISANDYVLLVAGDGPECKKIKRYEVEHSGIKYLGHIDSPKDLARIYASSDVFIMPGRNETFGMATIEALACGLPVVGVAAGGSRALITPEVGALARPGDPEDLAAKILSVANRDSHSLSDRCHSFVATDYSWEKVLVRYFEIYKRLIDEKKCVRTQAA